MRGEPIKHTRLRRNGCPIALIVGLIATTSSLRTSDAGPAAFALDATRPVRILWPLDIGPDALDGRTCLRARQGVNEIQNPGGGKCVYVFTVEQPGRYRSFFRVRWISDGVGVVGCNNSWFAAFDGDECVRVGDPKDGRSTWHWEPGPSAQLEAGVHWLRVDLREDGALMDRVVIAEGSSERAPAELEATPLRAFRGLQGSRPPIEPQTPLRAVEIHAIPSASLCIGKGHVNEITVIASWHGPKERGFSGTIQVRCSTVPKLEATGEMKLACAWDKPFTRNLVRLKFPEECDRRAHQVVVAVKDHEETTIFRREVAFTKGYAWAFLGPFKDSTRGLCGTMPPPKAEQLPAMARRGDPTSLGLADLPLAGGKDPVQWRLVDDGSCYDELCGVDLRAVFGPVTCAFAYAVTWVEASTNLPHRSFNFQADDSASLWINNGLCVMMPRKLPMEANRLWTSARVKRGLNPVVIKIAQDQRYWGFRLDVIDWHWQGRRGDVVRGAEAKQWPK